MSVPSWFDKLVHDLVELMRLALDEDACIPRGKGGSGPVSTEPGESRQAQEMQEFKLQLERNIERQHIDLEQLNQALLEAQRRLQERRHELEERAQAPHALSGRMDLQGGQALPPGAELGEFDSYDSELYVYRYDG